MTNLDLFITLVAISAGLAWMISAVNPLRLTVDLLLLLERVLQTAWTCCLDLPETFADRFANPTRRQEETRQGVEVRD